MKIIIKGDAISKEIPIPAGEYWVALNAGTRKIKLMAKGSDIEIPATRRRMKSHSKRMAVKYYNGGGKVWSLEVNDPLTGDWVAFIEVNAPAPAMPGAGMPNIRKNEQK